MKMGKKLPVKKIIIGGLVLAAIGGGAYLFLSKSGGNEAATGIQYTTENPTVQNLSQSISGTAALAAADSYIITSLVEEEILSSYFEEGDVVQKDMVLYELDSSDAQSTIETNQISLNASQRNYQNALEDLNNLTVYSDASGTLVTLNVEAGDQVSTNQPIGTVQDNSTMTIKVMFPADDADTFSVGGMANVTLDGSYETVQGTITNIAQSTTIGVGNMLQKEVEISVSNPGGITNGQVATAEINGVYSSASATFEYASERDIYADVSGTVDVIYANEGDLLSYGSTILTLSSDSLEDSAQSQYENLQKSEISMENAQQTLEKYVITSPITGTVVEKNYKTGETAEQGEPLAVIYDLSYLSLTLNIDELDISDMEVGQSVSITSEALEGQSFSGIITKVSVVGQTSGGVTTYPVTVEVEASEDLLPGMNVDAEVVLESVENAMTIPSSALERNNRVLITSDSPSAVNAVEGATAPEGYVYVSVETGLVTSDSVQIISGLTQDDTIAYAQMTMGGTEEMSGIMMPGMPSEGGSMPSGGGAGMSGGRPQ